MEQWWGKSWNSHDPGGRKNERPPFLFFDIFQEKLSNNRSETGKPWKAFENNLIFRKNVVAFPVELVYTNGGAKWSKRAIKWRGDEAI
ncbi:MAG: hypothetical protein IJX04_06080 [Oscillospiraceae bacterium]|nr:hypothetical protein [Oscillospiraceae bacterium]